MAFMVFGVYSCVLLFFCSVHKVADKNPTDESSLVRHRPHHMSQLL